MEVVFRCFGVRKVDLEAASHSVVLENWELCYRCFLESCT